MKISTKVAAVVAAATIVTVSPATADEVSPCSTRITRANVVQCALEASLLVKAEGYELEAADGRKLAVSPILPANPVLSLSAARRSIPGDASVYNWNAALSQEIEIAGQRGVRRDAAQAEIDAQTKRVLISRRDVAATVWIAFFDAVSSRDEERLAARLTAVTQAVSIVAHARAEKGLIAPVDADVADAATIRVLRAKLAAERGLAIAEARLASLLGLEPTRRSPTLEGELVPLPGVDKAAASPIPKAAFERPEVLALDAERKALELRADAFRRARVPNPTVSAFVQNDGFNERVLGFGLALPIPLPGNVGRTFVGEIAEAEALARRAETERDRLRREIQLAIVTAMQAYDSRAKEVEAFTPERLSRADDSLRALGQEVEAGRVSVRDAVVVQQALIELLQANVAARKAWCLASVDLARAAGVPLERGAP